METIKLYIADLAAYNRGTLQGEWITVGPEDTEADITYAIGVLLEEWDAEEYAIHDYEGLPKTLYSEHMDLEKVAAYTTLLDRFSNEVVKAYFDTPYWREVSPAEWERDIDDRFRGVYTDRDDWAYRHFEMCGWLEATPDPVETYIDFEAWARDAELSGDVDIVEMGMSMVVVFDAF